MGSFKINSAASWWARIFGKNLNHFFEFRHFLLRARDGLVMLLLEKIKLLPDTREFLVDKMQAAAEVGHSESEPKGKQDQTTDKSPNGFNRHSHSPTLH